MTLDERQIETLSAISGALNESEDVLDILDKVLAQLVELAGQRAGWIFLRGEVFKNNHADEGFYLASHYGWPAAPDIDDGSFWQGGCECQDLCGNGQLEERYKQLLCGRFARVNNDYSGFENHATFPLRSGQRLLGILNVVASDGEIASPQTLSVLTIASAQLSTALDRRRLADLVRTTRDREQTALLNLSTQLLSRSDPDDVMSYLVEETFRLFEADGCALLLPDEQPGYLVFRAAAGWHSDPVVERRRVSSDAQSKPGRVMRDQVPFLSTSSADRGDTPEMTIEWLEKEKFEDVVIVPLVVDGQSIGALVVSMRTPRDFAEDEIRLLEILANQAGVAIVNAWLRKEEIRLQRLEKELSVGRKIQHSLLPASSPEMPGWQFSDTYRPARQVGGDLYDYFELPYGGKRLGLVIGDVADKGVPAALFMATSRTLIRSVALAGLQAASTLKEANKLILQDSPSELFLSAFYGILDATSGKLTYANAGHNPPLWFRHKTGEVVELQAEGIVLCVVDEISLEERSIDVAPGDALVFYTDGVTEAMNKNYEEFGLQRLRHVLATDAQKSAEQILEAIIEAIDAFSDSFEQSDDLTLVVAKRL